MPKPQILEWFQQACFLSPPPKIGTRFVNTTALTENKSLFSVFLVLGVFAVSGFWSFCERNGKKNQNKTTKKETRPRDANKKPLSLVTKKKTTRT